MPTYRFKDKTTGKAWTEFMSISERDQLVKDPNIEQLVHGAPMIVSGVGTHTHTPDGFRDVLREMKKKTGKTNTINIH